MRWKVSAAITMGSWGIAILFASLLVKSGAGSVWWVLMLTSIAFALGLGWLVLRPLPLVAAGSVVSALVVYLAWLGIWAAQCPDCGSGDWRRVDAWRLMGVEFGAFIALWTLGAIGLGLLMAAAYQRARGRRLT